MASAESYRSLDRRALGKPDSRRAGRGEGTEADGVGWSEVKLRDLAMQAKAAMRMV